MKNEKAKNTAIRIFISLTALGMAIACGGRRYPLSGIAQYPEAPTNFHRGVEEPTQQHNTESYEHQGENPFRDAMKNPLSTFSIDVDTAAYANVRRFLQGGSLPPKDAVRIEELINYFIYEYDKPRGEHPFAVNAEVAEAPWETKHRLLRIGLKGREIERAVRPATNLVFLLDVSGSMNSPNKLPLLIASFNLLLEQLDHRDRVAVVVYAGASGVVLPSTRCDERDEIRNALAQLRAGGSTNGGAGIKLAYQIARDNFIEEGANRVILATDGDFNVGVSSRGDLVRLIEQEAKSGVYLTVMGFGMGNYKDDLLESIADRGNGNYAYIDSFEEAKKTLVEQMTGTLVTIAKDVKIQIEFNPTKVAAWRLIGYENRVLEHEDFNNDKKDAGDIGAGHTVTALYEIVPRGQEIDLPKIDALRYRKTSPSLSADTNELLTLKLRYKEPKERTSRLMSYTIEDDGASLEEASREFHFVAAVAAFGLLLRDSPHRGEFDWEAVSHLAEKGIGADSRGYRRDFLRLVERARSLKDS